ncbi:MAG: prepilin-type N-terminal cleavage/methylation domain-containing protein [Magnetococcales bacterium]|nr:prepilin-type N-terminal cleavage/methylation domain-containing protein [Magnetococcales bacterium]
MQPRGTPGFTLIELLIAVVIIGILLALALPNYLTTVTKAARSDGQSLLMQVVQSEERYFTENLTYTSGLANMGYVADPAVSAQKYYQVAILTPAAAAVVLGSACPISTCFVAVATPQGRQASDGRLAIASNGQKYFDRNNNGSYADANENNWD